MKWIKKVLFSLLVFLIIFSLYAIASGKTYLFSVVIHNFAKIDDYQFFTNQTVATGKPQPWPVAEKYNQSALPDSTLQLLENLETVALVKISNDSLVMEKYWDGYSDSSLSGSFSMAKSFTSVLIGIAIREGKIKSVDQPVGDFIPYFKSGDKAKVTIKDLLTMSSGTDWNESYLNPLSITAELYYGNDVTKTALAVTMKDAPGKVHYYKSGDTQLLGLIIEQATGVSLSEYAAEKLWKPMGAVHPALWSVDHEKGAIKAYCCFNSNARDFARLGQMMLNKGKWNGQEIIDSMYFSQSITPCKIPDREGNVCDYYGYQWWIDPEHPEVFYARGILGQYIIIIPSTRTILVRLGKKTSKKRVRTVPTEVRHLINWGLASN